ncbi:DEAD/DEAH box helicase [Aliiroseovarius marinus]|uniref:DEAD/DEAH box helicase n=1 Tax=Aliiroseovarius marinus TaxID=2500159 RepID=UPI003D7CF15D
MKQLISDALAERGYDTLTPVQTAVSDPELTGRDMLVSAQTGSGKTVGFGLAIAPVLLGEEDAFPAAAAPLGLVIAPTRELALQVKRELAWLFGKAGVVMASCVGGMDMRDERRALARGAHIVVATPGRLRDHIMRGSIDLTALRSVVLDEADEMLDLGFREDLEFILDETPEDRQTLLFSATVPKMIATLAGRYQSDAHRVTTVAEKSQHADIEYHAHPVAARDVENAIINVLRFHEAPNAIIFCNTRAMVTRLTTRLSNRGFAVVALSGELTQSERSNALQAMRDGRARICVATDVAARGIDLPKLDLVIHADLPTGSETLLHRSGRTGRAGRKGTSALIVPPAARKKAERLLRWAKLTARWTPAPQAADVRAADHARILSDEVWTQEATEDEVQMAAELAQAFDANQLAQAYLKLYHRAHAAPEELSAVDAKEPKKREDFGPSTWFTLAKGRNDNADPRHLLPMICGAGGLTKTDIGAIRIFDDKTYIEIKEAQTDAFLKTIGPEMAIEGFALTRLDKAPDLPRQQRPDRKGGGFKRGPKRDFDGPKPHRKGPRPDRDTRGERPRGDNDDRPRKTYKPKKSHDPEVVKPLGASAGKKPKSASAEGDAPRKPRHKPAAGAPTGAKGKPATAGKKGPPPPKGKANSKKNKARAAAAKAEAKAAAKARRKGKTAVKGGDAAPKRS